MRTTPCPAVSPLGYNSNLHGKSYNWKGGTNVMVVINLYLIRLRSIIHDYKGFVPMGLRKHMFGWGEIGQRVWEECGEGINMIQKTL